MVQCLLNNFKEGIFYHPPKAKEGAYDLACGHYDMLEGEEDIIELIKQGDPCTAQDKKQDATWSTTTD